MKIYSVLFATVKATFSYKPCRFMYIIYKIKTVACGLSERAYENARIKISTTVISCVLYFCMYMNRKVSGAVNYTI